MNGRVLLGLAVISAVAAAWFGGLGKVFAPAVPFSILSGSENRALEPIIMDWARASNVELSVTYLGSVDISRELGKGIASSYDAVWPANSLWIELGDTAKVVKHTVSILRSPVVLGLRRSVAEKLGWIGRGDITIQMIQSAAASNEFRLAMTSATQSNSGAAAYLGFLYALAGSPDMLTMQNLEDPALLDGVRALLAQIDRSSGSSGWLKDALVANPDAYDAMFNYESVILEANQDLEKTGGEPLYIIYPANGLSVADSPMGYVSKGEPNKEETFLALQKHLLSPEIQRSMSGLGRRSGLIGLASEDADTAVWRADWGVDLARDISPVPTPSSDVIGEALRLYQTELRKPSLTVWVLDVSGSMEGEPLAQLKQAMALLLDKEAAAVNLLQPSRRDITVIVPFNDRVMQPMTLVGDADTSLRKALAEVNALQAGGGTDLYGALIVALKQLQSYSDQETLFDYLPAIVAMTDGASDTDNLSRFRQALEQSSFGRDVPIHAIAFGSADEAQLSALTDATIGRLFVADTDLSDALRQAKGYN